MEPHHDNIVLHTPTLERKLIKPQCVTMLKQVTHTCSHAEHAGISKSAVVKTGEARDSED